MRTLGVGRLHCASRMGSQHPKQHPVTAVPHIALHQHVPLYRSALHHAPFCRVPLTLHCSALYRLCSGSCHLRPATCHPRIVVIVFLFFVLCYFHSAAFSRSTRLSTPSDAVLLDSTKICTDTDNLNLLVNLIIHELSHQADRTPRCAMEDAAVRIPPRR
jgi:hypothetical protein